MKKNVFILLSMLFFSLPCFAQETVKVGVLKFGTVNWLIDVIKHHQLDKKNGFTLAVTQLSSKNASTLALQSKAVDIIVSDWLWVNRQRFNQRYYTLAPTSMVSGGVYIAADLGIKSVADLSNKKIGIAGGAVDKNWLLLQAYAKAKYNIDIQQQAKPSFMVPPLLNRLMLRGDLSAAINFWHYGARLKAAGYQQLVTVSEMLLALGIDKQPPLLGWVFDEKWAKKNQQTVERFLSAAKQAKDILYHSDQEWHRIRPLLKAKDDVVFQALKNDYRAGVLKQFGEAELAASHQLFKVLAKQGGRELVGKASYLQASTFWPFAKKQEK